MTLLCILGPTAVGKTEIAINIALKINAEIVSVDSRQIYRKMDIGTAKPTAQQLKLVPHHAIDCINPDQYFSVADYQSLADKAIADIKKRGKVPMLVGGSGMYFRAIIDGIFEGPNADKELRKRLKKEAEIFGIQHLYERLKSIDPKSAAKIHNNDLIRIIRALEVFELSGNRISDLQQQWNNSNPRYPFIAFALNRPRDELYKRIESRIDKMITDGFLNEVRSLADYDRNLPSMNCLGYKELLAYLDGKCSFESAVELIKRNTRHYAKRQLTWFRKDKRIKWIDLSTCPSPESFIIDSINF
ncbi:MAG: tRNA (adenosine(37)-N6)-dimethylallyltransferase MiaA [Candidatus Poribacteria bacterium]